MARGASAARQILSGFGPASIGIGIAMTVAYGTLFYSFAIIAPAIRAEFGWTDSFVFGAFSLALFAPALLASLAGRMSDNLGGRAVLVLGSVSTTLALAAMALVEGPALFVVALVAQQAMSVFALYEAGFAMLTQIHGEKARSPISAVTLIAGFSSTVFWPLCGYLLAHFTWREVYVWLAAINLAGTLPIYMALPRRAAIRPADSGISASPQFARPALTAAARRRALVLLAVSFAAGGFAIAAVQAHLPRLLLAAGYEMAAAAAFGALIGPAQVAARVADILFGHSRHPLVVAVAANLSLALGAALLFFIAAGPAAAAAFALFYGAGQGLAYVIRGAIPLALFGPQGYGALTGRLNAVRIALSAAAPFAVAAVSDAAGNAAAIAAILAAAAIGAAALVVLLPLARTTGSP
jgi:hypothetical protein